jgi:XisI protein
MDKIEKYRNIIKSLVKKYHTVDDPTFDEFETQMVLDDTHEHYFLMDVGWNKMQRIHGCIIHIDLKINKIWVQQDWTDAGVVDDLLKAGVPKEDIVLAFHAPYKRPYTGYAVS